MYIFKHLLDGSFLIRKIMMKINKSHPYMPFPLSHNRSTLRYCPLIPGQPTHTGKPASTIPPYTANGDKRTAKETTRSAWRLTRTHAIGLRTARCGRVQRGGIVRRGVQDLACRQLRRGSCQIQNDGKTFIARNAKCEQKITWFYNFILKVEWVYKLMTKHWRETQKCEQRKIACIGSITY